MANRCSFAEVAALAGDPARAGMLAPIPYAEARRSTNSPLTQYLNNHILALSPFSGRSGVKTAGDAILFQLKSLGQAQAETLARRLGITVQAVRQRLERLLAEQPV